MNIFRIYAFFARISSFLSFGRRIFSLTRCAALFRPGFNRLSLDSASDFLFLLLFSAFHSYFQTLFTIEEYGSSTMARHLPIVIKVGSVGNRLLLKVKIMEFMVNGCARHAGAIFAVVEQWSFGRSVAVACSHGE